MYAFSELKSKYQAMWNSTEKFLEKVIDASHLTSFESKRKEKIKNRI